MQWDMGLIIFTSNFTLSINIRMHVSTSAPFIKHPLMFKGCEEKSIYHQDNLWAASFTNPSYEPPALFWSHIVKIDIDSDRDKI